MKPSDLTKFKFPYAENVILLFEGGSRMHGGTLEGSEADTDLFGLYIEPPEKILGVDAFEHFVHHTGSGPRGTNTQGDYDICLYGLQKWTRLALKGNPSVLSFLWAPSLFEHRLWQGLKLRPEIFLARSHIGAYLGYANAQLERLYGTRGQKNCNRTFLEAQKGYDTKYAMHIVRLLLEARELMQFARISYPNPRADLLRDIRQGKYKMHEVVDMAQGLEVEALEARDNYAILPESLDRQLVGQTIAQTYRDFWHV